MPRFVVLEHDWPHLHWDLMLEQGDGLRTWRLESMPRDRSWIAAEPLAGHRKIYLDYEGPLSGERGSVVQWDCGVYEEITRERVNTEDVAFRLHGKRLYGDGEIRGRQFYFSSTLPDTGTSGIS